MLGPSDPTWQPRLPEHFVVLTLYVIMCVVTSMEFT